jgi:hypothetical protein
MIYTSRLDGAQVTINPPQDDKKYAIMLSGGFDSAVLLYFLHENGYDGRLTTFTIPKADGSHVHATNVINYFNQAYDMKLPQTILVGDPTVFHRLMSKTAVEDIFTKHRDKCDILYNALNQVHPDLADGREPQRDRKEPNEKYRFPFVDLYKTHIVDFMYEYGLEAIMPITHSCTERPDSRCNECWQCGERAWAFTQLLKEDQGTI